MDKQDAITERHNPASIEFSQPEDGNLRIVIAGRLDMNSTGPLWKRAVSRLSKVKPKTLIVEASSVDYCDGAGVGLLLELKRRQEGRKGSMQIDGLKQEFEQLMTLFDPGLSNKPEPSPPLYRRVVEQVGKAPADLLEEFKSQISFTGEVFVKLLNVLLHPGRLRWKDTLLIAEKSGADAVGIIVLFGFLIGVILTFQSAIGMKKFGAEIYVADLVVIVLFRELGPLLTAFVLAARTGSAFAAEIGTMKVNEEIDALTTMGHEPVRFLVIPRILAGVFVTPLLTMFNNLFGLIGCAVVMISIGFTPVTFLNQIQEAATLTDLFGGLAKTLVFGSLIAGIGCLRGLQTKTGASAVGDSATRAVVSGIVAIVFADGVFAVVYYFLGI
jgi:phospholipid/cholesterol/gamma-HCH transport system permease protein